MIPFHSRQRVPFFAGTMILSASRIVFSSVGNDQCRFSNEKILPVLLSQFPTFIVKGVCRFVKKENRRIFPKDAEDGDMPFLSNRKKTESYRGQ